MAAVRSRLDEAAWVAAWAEGRAMTFEKAVENTHLITLEQTLHSG